MSLNFFSPSQHLRKNRRFSCFYRQKEHSKKPFKIIEVKRAFNSTFSQLANKFSLSKRDGNVPRAFKKLLFTIVPFYRMVKIYESHSAFEICHRTHIILNDSHAKTPQTGCYFCKVKVIYFSSLSFIHWVVVLWARVTSINFTWIRWISFHSPSYVLVNSELLWQML